MNYLDFVDDIATRSNRGKLDAKRDVDTVLAAIGDALVRGEEIRLPGFGTLVILAKEARTGRNPRTGEAIEIAAKRVPKLRPAKALMQRLNPPPASAAQQRRQRA